MTASADKQKPSGPGKARKGKTGPRVSKDEAERMFSFWCETQNMCEVARTFRRSRATITEIARREKWKQRYRQVEKNVQRKTERKVVRSIHKKVERAEALEAVAFAGLFAKDDTGKSRLKYDPRIRDYVAAAQYADELRERYPTDGSQDSSVLSADLVEAAMGILTALGDAALAALGNHIARTFSTPEEAFRELAAQNES